MGVGDEVPAGIAQLGAEVKLLDEQDLASGDLSRFDAIMTGTRAYAVRDDLKTYNRRLLDYVKNGGNLIVLYNTQEFDAQSVRAVPGAAAAQRRGGVGRGFAGARSSRRPIRVFNDAEQDHESRFRRLGRAARIEVLDRRGTRPTRR